MNTVSHETELHQQMANNLAGLLAQRQAEAHQVDFSSPEVIAEQFPFLSGLKKEMGISTFFSEEGVPSGLTGTNEEDSLPEFFSELIGDYGVMFDYSDGDDELQKIIGKLPEEQQNNLRGVVADSVVTRTARKELSYKRAATQFSALMQLTFIAAHRIPKGWDGSKPKKHKNESFEDKVFRRAVSPVFEEANRKLTKAESELMSIEAKALKRGRGYAEIYGPGGEYESMRSLFNSTQLHVTAGKLLQLLQSPDISKESVNLELRRINEITLQTKAGADETVPVEETIWTILPKEELEEIVKGAGEAGGSTKENRRFVDPERIKKLARLALDWGEGARLAVANLDKSGNYDYRAAILPQVIDGIPVEHAIAENPASKNAIYAFRAERGIDNGEVWLTWKDVLNNHKPDARALGARQIKHTAFVDENVLEYLTRNPKDLDKPGYRR